MKTFVLAMGLALPVMAQQPFDFHSLDKFDAIATNKTKITLNSDMLKLASGLLGHDDDAATIRSLVDGLKGIYIRTYEFDRESQYNQADVEPLRTYLRQQQWSKIIESQEGKELSEIYVQPLPNSRFGGVAIISTEARELTVVYISGVMNMDDLEKLSGNMGIPDLDLKKGKKPDAKAGKGKKDDEE
ncbi:MAG TPA: DUF4252 domain-containing protein [Bryobacteraceae bacterium]|nr:DUF4252 domain-containing protein [Bryobacteraceae bacterium]